MRKIFISIISMIFGLLGNNAQTVSVTDIALNSGETKEVSINLDNMHTSIVSFQIDLILPDGITLNKENCSLSSRITDAERELTIGRLADGGIRLTSTSLALKPVSGTSGELIKLSLTAADNAKGGVATLHNIRLATSNSEKLMPADTSFNIDVLYSLTYEVDGEVYKSDRFAYGSILTPEIAPTKEGHTFNGWSEIPETMPAHDIVVKGSFSVNFYFLFYINGDIYKTYSVEYGTPLTPETFQAEEGHTFSGWSEIPETMPAHDVTVQGQYTINSHTLTYILNGVVYKSFLLEYHQTITPEPDIVNEGYTFSGWSEIPELMPDNDVEVTGTLTVNIYLITYKVDGEIYKTDSIAYGTILITETEPTKEGYTFSGWSEIPETMPAHDVVVSGRFMINTYALAYEVNGELYKMFLVKYGTVVTPEPDPVREGYTFSGWSGVPKTMPAHDVSVRGEFRINTHKLTYIVNGVIYKTYQLDYHQTIEPEPEPVREGYTFSGWSEIPELMPDNDVVVTGTFTVNSYNVTFMYGNEVLDVISVEFGTEIPLPENLNSNRYTLIEWLDVPETMPAHDIIIYADFVDGISTIANSMKPIIYDLQGRRMVKPQKGIYIIDGKKVLNSR